MRSGDKTVDIVQLGKVVVNWEGLSIIAKKVPWLEGVVPEPDSNQRASAGREQINPVHSERYHWEGGPQFLVNGCVSLLYGDVLLVNDSERVKGTYSQKR